MRKQSWRLQLGFASNAHGVLECYTAQPKLNATEQSNASNIVMIVVKMYVCWKERLERDKKMYVCCFALMVLLLFSF